MPKTANAVYVQGVLDWVQKLLDWLAKQDLAELAAEAKALYDLCVSSLDDGKLTFAEIAAIAMKVLTLLGRLKLAGLEV